MPDPNEKPKILGPNSLNMDIVEMGGEEDTRVRPLREVLRKLHEQAMKDPKRQAAPPKENGETSVNEKPTILAPDKVGEDTAIVWMGGEEDTRVRPLREVLQELREQAEEDPERHTPPPPKENGETDAP